jgi:hypothetical protein
MAASKAELWTQLANAVKILDQTYVYGATHSPNLAGLVDTLQQSYEGTHISATQAAVTSMRSSFSSLLANGANILNPLILELAKIGYGSIATSASAALDDIYLGMAQTSPTPETVAERAMTYGAIAVGGANIGTGTVYRCTKDQYDYNRESGQPVTGIVKARCITDRSGGRTLGNEEFLLYGSGVGKTDEIELGTCANGSVSLSSKRAIDGLAVNPSFETYSGTGATLAFSGWTLDDNTHMTAYTADYFRKSVGVATGVCLQLTENAYVQQNMGTTGLDLTKPVFLIVRYKRLTSCDGTLTISLGSQTNAVTFSAESGWNDLCVGVGADEEGHYDVFKEDNSGLGFKVKIALTSRTTGTLLIDDVVLAQPTLFNGLYYMVVAGVTDFLKEDFFTFTDSSTDSGRIQYWLARLYGKHLPHTSGAETYADA